MTNMILRLNFNRSSLSPSSKMLPPGYRIDPSDCFSETRFQSTKYAVAAEVHFFLANVDVVSTDEDDSRTTRTFILVDGVNIFLPRP